MGLRTSAHSFDLLHGIELRVGSTIRRLRNCDMGRQEVPPSTRGSLLFCPDTGGRRLKSGPRESRSCAVKEEWVGDVRNSAESGPVRQLVAESETVAASVGQDRDIPYRTTINNACRLLSISKWQLGNMERFLRARTVDCEKLIEWHGQLVRGSEDTQLLCRMFGQVYRVRSDPRDWSLNNCLNHRSP